MRPSATPHDALTARKYDWMMVDVASGVDLFALEKFMATLSDWFVTCHATVPAVFCVLAYEQSFYRSIAYPKAWREHASRDDQVCQHEA